MRLVEHSHETIAKLGAPVVTAFADQHGHVRLRVDVPARVKRDARSLQAILAELLSTSVTIRHPERRGEYSTLADAANDLADCYGRETARTSKAPKDSYQLDWVKAGRPFLVVYTDNRERITVSGVTIDAPLRFRLFDGHLRFVPWNSGEQSLPVWLLVAKRGGDAWKQVAEAIEAFTGHYEEFIVLLQLIEGRSLSLEQDHGVRLGRHRQRLQGYLSRAERAGLDLQPIFRLLVDHDRSTMQARKRQQKEFEASLHERVGEISSLAISAAARRTDYGLRIEHMSINVGGTGNIVNLGEMIAHTISTTTNVLEASKASDDLKSKLEALRDPIVEAAGKLPAEDAKHLLEDYEAFVKQAIRPSPNKELVKAQGTSIVDTVSKVAGVATTVTALIGAIAKLLGYG